MPCKNCLSPIESSNRFCHHCGAKIIRYRLSVKQILIDFFERYLNWDNSLFKTIKTMAIAPNVILDEYVSGVRKKYMNPLSFFIISASLYLIIINVFETQFYDMLAENMESQRAFYKNLKIYSDDALTKIVNDSLVFNKWFIKYYTIIMTCTMPIIALLSYIVFRKPYNYAEHVVFNFYIYGFVLYFSALFSGLALLFHNSNFLFIPIFMVFIIYGYSFKKLYKLSFLELVLKYLLFFLLLGLLFVILIVIGIIGVIIFKLLS